MMFDNLPKLQDHIEKSRPSDEPSAEIKAAAGWIDRNIALSRRSPVSIPEMLTPARAAVLLQRNPDNRHPIEANITKMVADIKEGLFQFNGEPIIISRDGLLNDGQQRCHAVVRANRSIWTIFVFGVQRDSRHTVDIGSRRTISQQFRMEGRKHAQNIPSTATFCWQFEHYGRLDTTNTKMRPSNQQIRAWIEAHPEIERSIELILEHRRFGVATVPALATAHYILSKIDAEQATDFLTMLMTGENLHLDHPAHTCRNRILGEGYARHSNSRDRRRLSAAKVVEYIIRAWNHWRAGDTLKRLQIGPAFPTPH